MELSFDSTSFVIGFFPHSAPLFSPTSPHQNAPSSVFFMWSLRKILLLLPTTRLTLAPTTKSFAQSSSSQLLTFSIMSSTTSDYAQERHIAELAVQRACLLTQRIFHSRVKGTVTKDDKSPVTLADYGAQALVIGAVAKNFPTDNIVGEEDAAVLREKEEVRTPTWQYVKETVEEAKATESELGGINSVDEMLELIDRGVHEGGALGRTCKSPLFLFENHNEDTG